MRSLASGRGSHLRVRSTRELSLATCTSARTRLATNDAPRDASTKSLVRLVAMLTMGVLVLSAPDSASAQSVHLSGRIHVAGDTARPLSDVEVTLLPGQRSVRSDSAGAFRFTGVAPGVYTLRARRVGYEVFSRDVTLTAHQDSSPDLVLPMRTGPRRLAEITISGQRVLYPARLTEPYQRASRARGTFFTRELIDSLQPFNIASLIIRAPGVRVNDRAITVARCDNHGARPGMPGNIHVYLDGVRQTTYGSFLQRGALEAVRDLSIASVQLVEVHNSINTIPPEYADDACAVILIWSK